MIYTVTLNPAIDHTMCFPRLVHGGLNRASYSRADLGGKGVNVSRALRQFGVETVAMGSARPVASNKTDSGKAQNRRVEILVIQK